MDRPYQQIDVEKSGDAYCVRLRNVEVDEKGLEDLGAEIARVIDEESGRFLVLQLGPNEPMCLYSVFLAKLINLQRRLQKDGGELALTNVSEATRNIFQVAGLEKFFRFFPDRDAAIDAFKRKN